jgi:uncharacterized damage-inducible protein DinB
MIKTIKLNLFQQFGASIKMLQNAIEACPNEIWHSKNNFWYLSFHTLFFLDYYLTLKPKDFYPPSPFTLSEFEDKMPDRVYSKEELLKYCDFCKAKCKELLLSLNEEILEQKWVNESGTMNFSVFEILLYNLRHVQHHVGQLNLLLRQNNLPAPDWEYREEELI